MVIMTKSPSNFAERSWPVQGQWTYEDWLQLPDDGSRYEVIDGELYMAPPPAIAHQSSSNRLATGMTVHSDRTDAGRVFNAPIGVRLPNQPVPFEPDIVFISNARKEIIGDKYIEGVPDLLVEILSPSNWPYDRQTKFEVYRDAGVPEYWIVDYRKKTIEVFVLDGGEYVLQKGILGMGEMAESEAMTGFQIAVSEVFRDL